MNDSAYGLIDRFLLAIMQHSSARLAQRLNKRLGDRFNEGLSHVFAANKVILDEVTDYLAGGVAGPSHFAAARDLSRELMVSATRADQFDRAAVRSLGRDLIALALEPENFYLIPGLETRSTPPLNTWIYQNEVMKWDIEPDELVLDVGSGGWPFSKATHLADMHTGETSHRKEGLRRDGRPFLTIDITGMPFRDQVWDFVFCSHVLEHLTEPGKALREIMRVGRRGYIEAPTRLSDVMLNFTGLKGHHRWHSLVLGETLVFIEWREEERHDVGTNYFFQCLHSNYRNEFQSLFENNWDLFFSRFHWTETIKFIVIDKTGKVADRSE